MELVLVTDLIVTWFEMETWTAGTVDPQNLERMSISMGRGETNKTVAENAAGQGHKSQQVLDADRRENTARAGRRGDQLGFVLG